MKLTWKDLTIDFSQIDHQKLTEDWQWVLHPSMFPILISSIGDMFLQDNEGKIYWLNVGDGTLTLVAEDLDIFNKKLQNDDIANEWFMFDLVMSLKTSGLELTEGNLFSYKILPVLGGLYEPENFTLMDIERHFSFAGSIHEQIKDLPDGTSINFNIKQI